MITIGEMRERIDIQAPVPVQNEYGEDEGTAWTRVRNVWAAVQLPDPAREVFSGDTERARQRFAIHVRRDPTLTITDLHRIVWGRHYIDIESVIDLGGKHATMEIIGVASDAQAAGEIVVGGVIGKVISSISTNADGDLIAVYSDGSSQTLDITDDAWTKTITVENPTATEDITVFRVPDDGRLVSSIVAVVRGSTPSVTWTLRYGTDRSLTGTELIPGGVTTVSTSGQTQTLSVVLPVGSWVWLETSGVGGTVEELSITLSGTVT